MNRIKKNYVQHKSGDKLEPVSQRSVGQSHVLHGTTKERIQRKMNDVKKFLVAQYSDAFVEFCYNKPCQTNRITRPVNSDMVGLDYLLIDLDSLLMTSLELTVPLYFKLLSSENVEPKGSKYSFLNLRRFSFQCILTNI